MWMRLNIWIIASCLLLPGGCQDYTGLIEISSNMNENLQMVCGNGRVEVGEECDLGSANSDTSPDGCRTDCRWAQCGDGVADSGEECDRQDLAGKTCEDLGYNRGVLGCTQTCTWDVRGCTWDSTCGNGVVDIAFSEECDDGNLRSHDGCSSGCTVEIPRWVEITTANSPLAQSSHALAFDSARGRMVLLGYKSGSEISHTWEYDGHDWAEVTPDASPVVRFGHAMAYDSAHSRVVLFGGETYDDMHYWVLGDTWEYDGIGWYETTPSTSPPPRRFHVMAYDQAHGCVVLFSGCRTAFGCSSSRSDTWKYDGSGWEETIPEVSPNARSSHAMNYDALRGRSVLFAGFEDTGWPQYERNRLADTWEYDGTEWVETTPGSSPPARSSHAMTFDVARDRTVVFGGGSDVAALSDTWEYDGISWVETSPAHSPPARSGHAMAYDSSRGRVVLFGGRSSGTFFNDTWEYRWASEWPDELCDNVTDDDLDGLTDCDDPDCEEKAVCFSYPLWRIGTSTDDVTDDRRSQ